MKNFARQMTSISLILFIYACPVSAQSPADAERAIRRTAYETTKAFLSANVRLFKQNVTERSISVLRSTFDLFQQNPKSKDELQRAGVASFDQFLEYIMLGMSPRLAGPLAPDKAAEKISNESQLAFISNTEAKILFNNSEFARARLSRAQWKIDLTTTIKRILLEEVEDPQMKAKIKNF
ncbi:MAG: hypothetical protein AB1631_08765 [Acidobacteriota bacterium]